MRRLRPDGSIVILTGAGISRESGLHTFRDKDGIWAKVRVEDVATPEAFQRDPGRVHDFYNARRRQLVRGEEEKEAEGRIEPNPAHYALAHLEAAWPGRVTLVTQNIDNLHQRAGSKSLIAMHGELLKARCQFCGALLSWREDLSSALACPACAARGGLRPHVVWFGEIPLQMEEIYLALSQCALFVSIGTSGHVYPAAGFVATARNQGAETVELNLEASEGASLFHEAIHGPASQVVPAFVATLLARTAG